MPAVCMAMPLLPGKEAEAKKFAAEVSGPRAVEFAEFQTGTGTTRETWHLQQTPDGTMLIVWFEDPDPEKAFEHMATASDDFSKWFRGRIQDVTGADMSEPQEGPPPETLLDWSA
jgi:hypothetical protein